MLFLARISGNILENSIKISVSGIRCVIFWKKVQEYLRMVFEKISEIEIEAQVH